MVMVRDRGEREGDSYDAEVLGGCVPEGCDGAVMKAIAFYDAEVLGLESL